MSSYRHHNHSGKAFEDRELPLVRELVRARFSHKAGLPLFAINPSIIDAVRCALCAAIYLLRITPVSYCSLRKHTWKSMFERQRENSFVMLWQRNTM